MDVTPTEEQQAAVAAYLTGENLVIEAGAGTGKTATLQMIAAAQPGRRGLYIAFNKALQLEAARKFAGTSVESRTVHSLAYRDFGAQFQGRFGAKRLFWAQKAKILGVTEKLTISGPEGMPRYVSRQTIIRLVTETVDAFCVSAAPAITVDLVPVPETLILEPAAEVELRTYIVGVANRYWADLQRPDGVLPYKHNYYLKSFQLSQPVLPYDFILFDEAQDADPLMVSIVENQKQLQVAAVGDPEQAIYGWRGAVAALDHFGGTRTQLTQSFRFGDKIAEEANFWLDLLNADLRLKGVPDKPSSVWKSKREPEAILTRSNAGAIREVLDSQAKGIKVGIVGEKKTKELRSLATAALELQEKGHTSHRDLDVFESWDQVVAFSQLDENSDIAALVKVVDEYGAEKVVQALDSCVPPENAAQVVSTVHVAKGLEWLHVRVSNDFYPPRKDIDGNQLPIPREEARTAYVAVTRAQRHLDASGLDWARVLNLPVAA